MNKEIIKGNKLIAELMGAIELDKTSGLSDPSLCLLMNHPIKNEIEYVSLNELKYHSSWSWLMPVVEKIATIPSNYPNGIFKYMVNIEFNPISGIEIKDMYKRNLNTEDGFEISIYKHDFITNTWFAVVEFIKWHNNNKITNV